MGGHDEGIPTNKEEWQKTRWIGDNLVPGVRDVRYGTVVAKTSSRFREDTFIPGRVLEKAPFPPEGKYDRQISNLLADDFYYLS